MQNEYGLGQGWRDVDNSILFLYISFASVAPREQLL